MTARVSPGSVFVGLIIASGPPGARFAIGISISAAVRAPRADHGHEILSLCVGVRVRGAPALLEAAGLRGRLVA